MTRKQILLVVIALLITYGSLYPFTFVAPPEGVFERLFAEAFSGSSRGDVLGNVGLFIPWGLLGMLTIAPERAISRTLVIGFLLALGLQIIQVWIPSRTPALYDSIWNMAGCLIGMALGYYVSKNRHYFAIRGGRNPAALWLLATWILIEWLPLIPSLDLQLIKNQLKSLLVSDSIDIGNFAISFAISMLFGELLSRRFNTLHSALILPAIIAAMLCGKLILVDTTLTTSALAGYICGIIGWWAMLRSPSEQRTIGVVIALITAYSIQALTPFSLKLEPSSFEFLPFAGMLKGSMLDNVRSLASTLLVFFSILLLLRDSGSKTSVAAIGLALWVLLLESMQMFISARSATITEPLVVLIAGSMVSAISTRDYIERIRRAPAPAPFSQHPSQRSTISIRSRFLVGAGTIILIVVGLKILLEMPSIPYNVRELFRANGNILALSAFALALIWVGAGAAWLGDRLKRTAHPVLSLGPLTIIVALTSLALLWSSVTSESISDIVGSSNRYWFVINKNIWGDFWRELFLRLNQPSIISFLEACVRYWALYTPLIATLGLMLYVLDRNTHDREPNVAHGLPAELALSICYVLVLWLCKAIAFDWSSTDNLNELIARDGEWGLGGGGYLYGLLFLICLNAVLVSRISTAEPGKSLLTGLYSVIAVPLGWWLLNLGLEQKIEKYGNVYSGVQFLLGPDRQHALSSNQLLLRWCLLQTIATVVIGLGLWIGKQVQQRSASIPADNTAARKDDLP